MRVSSGAGVVSEGLLGKAIASIAGRTESFFGLEDLLPPEKPRRGFLEWLRQKTQRVGATPPSVRPTPHVMGEKLSALWVITTDHSREYQGRSFNSGLVLDRHADGAVLGRATLPALGDVVLSGFASATSIAMTMRPVGGGFRSDFLGVLLLDVLSNEGLLMGNWLHVSRNGGFVEGTIRCTREADDS